MVINNYQMKNIDARCRAAIRKYISENKQNQDNQLDYYKNLPSLTETIDKATKAVFEGGYKLEHQWHIDDKILGHVAENLKKREKEIQKSSCFERIIEIVNDESILGFGPLAKYDTALRIASKLGIQPTKVYLHRGTRIGAKAIGINIRKRRYLEVHELPKVFQDAIDAQIISVKHVEDILCIYKDKFQQIILCM
jgi:hypothetical protein